MQRESWTDCLRTQARRGSPYALGVLVACAAYCLFPPPHSDAPAASTDPLAASSLELATAPPPVTTTVQRGPIVASVQARGRIVPRSEFDLRTRVAGQVIQIAVDVGDHVKTGQLLLELDDTDEQHALKRAQIGLSTSKAKLAQAEQHLTMAERALSASRERVAAAMNLAHVRQERAELRADRLKDTLKLHYTSQEEYDSRVAEAREAAANLEITRAQNEELKVQELALEVKRQDVRCAQAQVQLDELALERAATMLRKTRVLAPMDGVVSSRAVQTGQILPVDTIMFRLSDCEQLFVTAEVDELHAAKLRVGQAVSISADALPGKEVRGSI
jgi:membrane fusion protein (multidrug efflux system)